MQTLPSLCVSLQRCQPDHWTFRAPPKASSSTARSNTTSATWRTAGCSSESTCRAHVWPDLPCEQLQRIKYSKLYLNPLSLSKSWKKKVEQINKLKKRFLASTPTLRSCCLLQVTEVCHRKRHMKGQKDARNTPAVWVSAVWQLSVRIVALTNMYPARAGVHVHSTDRQNLPVGRSCSKQTTQTVVRIYCVKLAVQSVCLPLMAVRVIANTSGDPCIPFLFLNTSFF